MIWLQLHPESLDLESYLDPSSQTTKLPQHEACAELTDFTTLYVSPERRHVTHFYSLLWNCKSLIVSCGLTNWYNLTHSMLYLGTQKKESTRD